MDGVDWDKAALRKRVVNRPLLPEADTRLSVFQLGGVRTAKLQCLCFAVEMLVSLDVGGIAKQLGEFGFARGFGLLGNANMIETSVGLSVLCRKEVGAGPKGLFRGNSVRSSRGFGFLLFAQVPQTCTTGAPSQRPNLRSIGNSALLLMRFNSCFFGQYADQS